MRAIVIEEHGGPEVLAVRDVPDPVPGPDEVLVRVVTSALNRADLLQRRGHYPGPPAEVDIPGMELAGRVVAVGARVREHRVGDAVMGIVAGWAHAELVAVHERQVIAVPEGLALTDAGAVPEVFFTAFDALVLQGGLRSGDWALVHAGASGVGTAAIQLARRAGAAVVATASTAKLDVCRELGAEPVDRTLGDWTDAVRRLVGEQKVAVVLDVVGGDYLARNLAVLRVGGTIVQVGVMGGGSTTVPLGLMLPLRATLRGTVLRARPIEEKIALSQRFAAEVSPGFTDGSLRPVIHARFPLDEIAAAHALMETNTTIGKIVLDVTADG
jgi:putative PIG3 family NAD(P)H quinone oxidoreductase